MVGEVESEITSQKTLVRVRVVANKAADQILFYKCYLCVCNVNFVLQFVESQKHGEFPNNFIFWTFLLSDSAQEIFSAPLKTEAEIQISF